MMTASTKIFYLFTLGNVNIQGLGKSCLHCGDGISDLAALAEMGIRPDRIGWALDGHVKFSNSRQLTCISAKFSISYDEP